MYLLYVCMYVILNNIDELLEEVVELVDSAVAPLEPLARVPQVAHDVSVLPTKIVYIYNKH